MSWQKVGKPFSGIIGGRGFAWDIGLHGTGEPGAPRKKEGDQSSPAGVFRLSSVFGLASPDQVRFLRFPYQHGYMRDGALAALARIFTPPAILAIAFGQS